MTGQLIAHYEILEKLGEGGMGAVYLAEDTRLHRKVALKFLPATLLEKEGHKTRFVHEARAAAALNHPNIATVYEINEAHGEIFIAMEYIEGQTLQEKIEAGPLKIKAVPFDLERRVVTGAPRVVMSGVDVRQRGPVSFSFSNTGRLAYSRQANTSRSLAWVNRSGNTTPLTDEKRGYNDPSISPDGKMIAFAMNADIYVLDISQGMTYGTPVPKTTGGSNFEPVWHPGSNRLVFSSDRSGRYHLYTMPVDRDEAPELLVSAEHEAYASSWSPDGEILAYYVRKTQDDRDIYVWSKQEGTALPFLATEANERAPMFSPDGRWIAYMSDATGRDEVWVRPYPSREDIAYQVSADGGTEPMWWPEAPLRGQRLSYRTGDQMMLVEVETAPRFRVWKEVVHFEGRFYKTLYRSEYAIHPHDDRFLMVAEEETYNQINVTLNWFETLKHAFPRGG